MFENLDFTQDIKDNLLIKPVNPALNPQMPTLQQQASQAMGLNTQLPQVNAYPTGTPAPQPQQPKSYATRYAELLDTLGIKSPQVDMQRAEKLKKQAQWNSMGNVLSAIFSGYMGSKGAPILNTTNEYVPAAMGEYEKMLAQDKENKYKDSLMKLQVLTQGLQQDALNDRENQRLQYYYDNLGYKKDLAESNSELQRAKLTQAAQQKELDRLLRGSEGDKNRQSRKEIAGIQQAGANYRDSNGTSTTKTKTPEYISFTSEKGVPLNLNQQQVATLVGTYTKYGGDAKVRRDFQKITGTGEVAHAKMAALIKEYYEDLYKNHPNELGMALFPGQYSAPTYQQDLPGEEW